MKNRIIQCIIVIIGLLAVAYFATACNAKSVEAKTIDSVSVSTAYQGYNYNVDIMTDIEYGKEYFIINRNNGGIAIIERDKE